MLPQQRRGDLAVVLGDVERRLAIFVASECVGAHLEQQLRALTAPAKSRDMQRCPAIDTGLVYVGAGPQQQPQAVDMALPGGPVQGIVAILICLVRLGTRLE